MIRVLKTALLCAASIVPLAGADWPQFRGADTSGVAADANPPVDIGSSIAWKAELPGRGISGVIAVGDRVYVTASSGYMQDRMHVLCFNAGDGRKRWERQFWATGRTLCHPKMCNATPTPASDGQRVFAFYSSNDLVCLDLDGNLEWFRGLTHDYQNASNSLGMSSSPVVLGETLVVQVENDSESLAVGINVATGENRWRHDRPVLANWTSPVVLRGSTPDDDLVVLQSGKGLSAVRPATGIEAWNYDKGCHTIVSTAVSGGLLFAPSNGVTALKPGEQGAPPSVLWQSAALLPVTPSPLVYEGLVYSVGSGGVLTCADGESGNQKWKFRLQVQRGDKPSGGMFSATPVAAGGHVYLVNEEGIVMVVRAGAEKGEIVASHDFGETMLATPAISGDALYLRSDKHLWKIARK